MKSCTCTTCSTGESLVILHVRVDLDERRRLGALEGDLVDLHEEREVGLLAGCLDRLRHRGLKWVNLAGPSAQMYKPA